MAPHRKGSKSSFVQQMIETRFQPTPKRQQMMMKQQQQQMRKRKRMEQLSHSGTNTMNHQYWTGVYKGTFYRIPKVTPTATPASFGKAFSFSSAWRPLPVLPKLYTPTSPPAKIPSLLSPSNSGTTTSCQIPKHPSTTTNTSNTSTSSCSSTADAAASNSTAATATVCAATSTTTGTKSTGILPTVVKIAAKTFRHPNQRTEFYERFKQWIYENYGTLILNFGSICTLIGFTRSDVLELRTLSVTGSVCAIAYHIATPPLRIPPLIWSSTFAFVNGYKIYEIVQEREGSVQLSTEQEEMYSNFFMPHGVTPKQFEIIYAKAEVLHIKKGTFLIRQTEAYQHVDLVVAGTTRASALGRFLTAASTTPTARDERVGGASGAWIGEMCLLERVWLKEQKKSASSSSNVVHQTSLLSPSPPQSRQMSTTPSKDSQESIDRTESTKESAVNFTDTGNFVGNNSDIGSNKTKTDDKSAILNNGTKNATIENTKHAEQLVIGKDSIAAVHEKASPPRKSTETTPNQQQPTKLKACRSMYTIVAQEDCVVLRWRHDVMEGLMEKSTDMRAALTRAMTAAIVGKVINFTVSRSKANQTWATWLGDWKYNAGAEVNIEDETTTANNVNAATTTTNTVMVDEAAMATKENLPNYPIRSFR